MAGFFDATCPKCGKRFGWSGELVERPPCPGCGHAIPAEELKAGEDALAIAEMQALLTRRRKDRFHGRGRRVTGP